MIICGIVYFAVITVVLGYSPCTTNSGKFAHPGECQLYYDCSRPVSDLPRVTEPNLFECEYPKLFDKNSKSCRPFQKVIKHCGSREIKSFICDTLKYRNAHAHGRPCWVDHLDCTGLGTGKYGFPHMPNTPYYAQCKNGRFVEKFACEKVNGQQTIFDPNVHDCVKPDDN